MNLTEISTLRLHNQKVLSSEFNKPASLVSWMGAMQAQDYSMAKWAIGSRLINSSEKTIEDSVNKGSIIRTHLMRPTWHFVSAEDVYWMLELTAPRIMSALKSRQRELELSQTLINKSNRVLTRALEQEGALTRDELVAEFRKAEIRTDDNRFVHLMACAEMDKIVCSGPVRNGKQTYALLHERVPNLKSLTHEESLAELAKRYFNSHGPATTKDFAWWSGLSGADIKLAMALVPNSLDSETIGNNTYWFKDSSLDHTSVSKSVFLLPAYDEFLISYSDRTASLSKVHNPKTVSINGIFRPIIVVDGKVAGLWNRKKVKNKIILELSFFGPLNKSKRKLAEEEAARYARFLGMEKETEIVFKR